MRASGNGDAGVCANNLLCIFRGENPYERVKGLNPRSVDRPLMDAEAEVFTEAEWCINTYEPRAALKGITVTGLETPGEDFHVSAQIKET